MTVSTHIWSQVPRNFCVKLREWERQFDYPLNDQQRFRIEHSLDYGNFFAAMGDAATIVVERHGTVIGVLSASIRTLDLGKGRSERWLYVGDVKINRTDRGKRVLHLLLGAIRSWVGDRCDRGYSVVMGGTRVTPAAYTGRVGIPAFNPVAQVTLLAIPTNYARTHASNSVSVATLTQSPFNMAKGQTSQLSRFYPRWSETQPRLRSKMEPMWLIHHETGCMALMEDTRKVKRLFDDAGDEIKFAHLTNLWCENPVGLLPLIEYACAKSRVAGSTELLVSVPCDLDEKLLNSHLGGPVPRKLEATVYATERIAGAVLPINSSEI